MKESIGSSWREAFKKGDALEIDDIDTVIPTELRGRDRNTIEKALESPLDRREAVGKIVSSGFGLLAAANTTVPHPEKAVQSENRPPEKSEEPKPIERREAGGGRTIRVSTGEMAGRKVGSLFAYYLGLKPGSEVPKEIEINFAHVLENLWKRKLVFIEREVNKLQKDIESLKKQKENALQKGTKDAADKLAKQIYAKEKKTQEIRDRYANNEGAKKEIAGQYEKKWNTGEITSVSMEDVVSLGDRAVAEINEHLDWGAFNQRTGPFPRLGREAVEKFVKPIAEKTSGVNLLSYSLTELMPSVDDGDFNVAEYAFLLKHGGSEFVASVPAIYDHWLSFGSMQFTSLALQDHEDVEGASHINRLLPEHLRIEKSVKYVNTLEEQLKAGHLFAIYNIASLVQDILKDDDKERTINRLKTLYRHIPKLDVPLLQYLASAHHSPTAARDAFSKWLDSGLMGSHRKHAKKSISEYILKSFNNRVALLKHLSRRKSGPVKT